MPVATKAFPNQWSFKWSFLLASAIFSFVSSLHFIASDMSHLSYAFINLCIHSLVYVLICSYDIPFGIRLSSEKVFTPLNQSNYYIMYLSIYLFNPIMGLWSEIERRILGLHPHFTKKFPWPYPQHACRRLVSLGFASRVTKSKNCWLRRAFVLKSRKKEGRVKLDFYGKNC